MNDNDARPAVPVLYWVVSVIGLLWNCMGGYDYIMSRRHNMDYINMATNGQGESFVKWMDGLPMLAQIGWPVGVWASLLGAVLLLARSRHAPLAFLVSLVGAIVSFGIEYGAGMPTELNTGSMKFISALVVVLIVFFWWYARRAATKGWLR